jgi:hypothetical protein
MTDYESVRSDWWALLNWHLKINGTRPNADMRELGHAWTDQEFGVACHLADPMQPRHAARTVQYWLDKRKGIVTARCDVVEKVLFAENPAYAAWRLDLRVAHQKALERRASSSKLSSRAPAIRERLRSDELKDQKAFSIAVREGLLMSIKGSTFLSPIFFRSLSIRCGDTRFITEMTAPDQNLSDCSSLLAKFLASLIIPALRTKNWTEDQLTPVVEEAGQNVRNILLKKAHELGLYEKQDDDYFVEPDVFHTFFYNFHGRLNEEPTKSEICVEMYRSWRDVVTLAIESKPEQDKGYIDMLSLFMYVLDYDNGSVGFCAEILQLWLDQNADKGN